MGSDVFETLRPLLPRRPFTQTQLPSLFLVCSSLNRAVRELKYDAEPEARSAHDDISGEIFGGMFASSAIV